MDNVTSEFYVEVCSDDQISTFSKTVLLNMLDLAEKAGAEKFYVCVRKEISSHDAFVRKFCLSGF
jgi:hypothetical protein